MTQAVNGRGLLWLIRQTRRPQRNKSSLTIWQGRINANEKQASKQVRFTQPQGNIQRVGEVSGPS